MGRLLLLGALVSGLANAGEWVDAADMNETRQYPGLALLPDGRVLAVTGHPLGGKSLESAEVYDPAEDVWQSIASLHVSRNGVQPAGLITLPSGNIFISGGGSGSRSVHEAEVLDPETFHWSLIASMSVPRCVHATVQLDDGRVLVTGGIDWTTNEVHASAEVFDEKTGEWSAADEMGDPRMNHAAVRLRDGRVLVIGGARSDSGTEHVLDSVDVYDPQTNEWSVGPPTAHARRSSRAVVLHDGRVMIVGGKGADDKAMPYVEIFNPKANEWTDGPPLQHACWGPTATVLPDGRVLVTGGMAGGYKRSDEAELFDPATGAWSAQPPLKQARNGHRAIVLQDGRVLIAGGFNGFAYLASCEIYVPD